uniref:Adenine phosphoribosyltransferase n=1 Tax=Timema cristinae TaxID=61476 RepID=A0A7R9CNG9_TIMCR|nr:unnamed protein product [Timema cristinae]
MEEFKEDIELVKSNISSYPDFPKPGILFRDIFSIFNNPKAAKALDSVLLRYVRKIVPQTDVVVALESRGFLFGPTLALELGVPFVPVRKKGKLPGTVYQQSYALEYGTDILEIQASSIQLGQKVLIVDDLIATGGTLEASCQLVRQCGGEVLQCLVVMELQDLKGKEKVSAQVESFIKF